MMARTRASYLDELTERIRGKDVKVVFPASRMPNTSDLKDGTLIAVDGAANWFYENGLVPDVVVTDLDGLEVFPKEPIYVVLLHGDNLSKLYKVYSMDKVVFSTQVFPSGDLLFTGGFTDGDRAVALAYRLGARSVRLMNFDAEGIGKYSKPKSYPLLSTTKMRKLKWAQRMLEMMAY
ncbi:MAG: 6-hydroxymethylpterin diphosphokinase MptE-like protein [Sulfolobaceae archaeon]|nr:DUF115 domain-containing protein [Sulfolobales archaeon]